MCEAVPSVAAAWRRWRRKPADRPLAPVASAPSEAREELLDAAEGALAVEALHALEAGCHEALRQLRIVEQAGDCVAQGGVVAQRDEEAVGPVLDHFGIAPIRVHTIGVPSALTSSKVWDSPSYSLFSTNTSAAQMWSGMRS